MPGCLPHLSLDFSSRPWFSTGKFVKCKVPYRISALTFLVVHGFLPPAVKKKKKCSNRSFRIEVLEVFEAFEAAPNTRDLQNIEAL